MSKLSVWVDGCLSISIFEKERPALGEKRKRLERISQLQSVAGLPIVSRDKNSTQKKVLLRPKNTPRRLLNLHFGMIK